MIEETVVLRRLEKLSQYIQLLQQLVRHPVDKFIADPFIHGNAERYLQLAIQACLDIGNHLLAQTNSKTPEVYRDIFILLGENKIIPMELARKMSPLAGLRNILVHDYLDVDLEKIHSLLTNNLDDFRQFVEKVSKNVFG